MQKFATPMGLLAPVNDKLFWQYVQKKQFKIIGMENARKFLKGFSNGFRKYNFSFAAL